MKRTNKFISNVAARHLVTLFVFATMIPLASNRPFFWGLWAATAAAIALVLHFWNADNNDQVVYFPVLAILAAAAYAAYASFTLFQLAPITSVFVAKLGTGLESQIVSRTISIAPGETWYALLRWLTYGVLFAMIFGLAKRSRPAGFFLMALSIIAGLQALYALVALFQFNDTVLVFEKTSYLGFATGTFINRNSLATCLSLGAIVSVTILTIDRANERRYDIGNGHKVFAGIALGFIFAALILTNSRMGIFAGFSGVFLTLCFRMAGNTKMKPLFATAIASFVVAAFFYGGGLIDRLVRVEGDFDGRLQLYQQVVEMIKMRWLAGYGAGTFAQAYPLFQEASAQSAMTWDYSHSTYLALWSGSGLVAGSLPIIVIVLLVLALILQKPLQIGKSPEAAAALGATATVGLHAIFDFSLEIQAVAVFYTAIIAVAIARLCRKSDVKQDV